MAQSFWSCDWSNSTYLVGGIAGSQQWLVYLIADQVLTATILDVHGIEKTPPPDKEQEATRLLVTDIACRIDALRARWEGLDHAERCSALAGDDKHTLDTYKRRLPEPGQSTSGLRPGEVGAVVRTTAAAAG